MPAPPSKPEQPRLTFASATAFRRRLKVNHATQYGMWRQIAKKDRGIASITYSEALDEALCYGWIDGQKQRHSEVCWMQKFLDAVLGRPDM